MESKHPLARVRSMLDLGLIALTVFLFGLMFALVAWFDRI